MARHEVVQSSTRQVALVCLPVHPGYAGTVGPLADPLDQRTPDPVASIPWRCVEVAQIADVLDPNQAAVEDEMRQPNQLSSNLCHERVDGLLGVQKSPPSGGRDLFRQCCITMATIEGVVPVPERQPSVVVRMTNVADDGFCGQRELPFFSSQCAPVPFRRVIDRLGMVPLADGLGKRTERYGNRVRRLQNGLA